MKVFISQPMNGKTNEEIKAERQQAIVDVKAEFPHEKIEVLDSFFENAPHEAKPLWFLGKSFEVLSQADIAYFCKGWREARGCEMEYDACCRYGISVMYG